MSEAKFTPGPWRVDAMGNIWSEDTDIAKMSTVNAHGKWYRDKEQKEHEANRNLISVAPDMYEALEYILTFFTDRENNAYEEAEEINGHIDLITETLCEARGESK